MTLIESIKKYIETCPLIKELDAKVKVDYLDEEISFSIEPIPMDTVKQAWVSGGGSCQYAFNLVGLFDYSEEAMMNVENSGFFEKFEQWINDNEENEIYPELDSGTPYQIKVTSNGYLFGIKQDMKTARYQIPVLFEYEK